VAHLKFDPAKLEKLNDPGRFETLRPDVMWDAFALENPQALVEIGAGTGMFAGEFARRAQGLVVYAADTVADMIAWMTENRAEVADGRVLPLLSTETAVPLGDSLADGVYMINLHHELADPDAIYREAHRLLRPGGRVLVVDWAPADTPKGPPAAVRASAGELAAFLKRAGFEDVEMHDGLPWHSLLTARRGDDDR
jgi:SAM-dependent methyltransferase